jgi:hypothetical protein
LLKNKRNSEPHTTPLQGTAAMSLKLEALEHPMFGVDADNSMKDDDQIDILDEFLDKRLYGETAQSLLDQQEQQQEQYHLQPHQIDGQSSNAFPRDDEIFTNFLTDEINKNDFLIFNHDATNLSVGEDSKGEPHLHDSFEMGIAGGVNVNGQDQLNVEATTPVSIETNTSPKSEAYHTPNSIDSNDSASYESARNILSQLKFGSNTNAQYNNDFPKRYLEADEASLPYKLQISSLPSYSRVETQIKLDLSVSPPPPQYLVHLPNDTIAKQKFCLSSPLNEDIKRNILFLETFVLTATTLKPCNICIRCIRREQKRASRRKAGAADNTSWSLDSNKRAIIFNCKEIISFPPISSSSPGSKNLDISARIVCYCRHHQEQKGFKLLFILKNAQEEILAKHLSTPIMIMDRKKHADDNLNGSASLLLNDESNQTVKPLSPTSFEEDSSEPHTSDSRVFKRKRLWSPELSDGYSITPQRKPSSSAIQSMHPNGGLQFSTHNSTTSLASQSRSASTTSTAPAIQRIIPAQGPLRGGIEVTLLGSNFKQGLIVKFGLNKALSTQCWSESTMVTYLPPAAQPGQVIVSIEDPELGENQQPLENRSGTSVFTYLDDTDRQMIELALQIVGLKMNGKLEDARNIARKIIGSDGSSSGGSNGGSNGELNEGINSANYGNSVSNKVFNELSASSDEDLILKVIQLLPSNPNLSICTSEGQTLLHLSCLRGYYKLVSLLLQKGARVDLRDVSGFTALHYASISGDRKSIELLLNCRAYAFVKADNGMTPEDVADSNVLDIFKSLDSSDESMSRKISSASLSSSIFSLDEVEWVGGKHVSRLTDDRFTSGDDTDYDSDEFDDDNIEASDEESDYEHGDDLVRGLSTEEFQTQYPTPESPEQSDDDLPSEKSLWRKVRNVFNQEDLPKYDDLFPSKTSLLNRSFSSVASTSETSTEEQQEQSQHDPEFILQKFFNQRKNFQNDKMLLFFWLPLLIVIMSSFILINIGWKFEFNDQIKEFIRKTTGNIMLGNERFKIYLNRHLSHVNEAVTSVINVT